MTVEPYRVERRMAFSSTTADTARIWRGKPRGPVRVGSDAHKALFCRMPPALVDTAPASVRLWSVRAGCDGTRR